MSSRDFGQSTQVRVVCSNEQFDSWWPEFEASMGTFPFVGFNCKFNSNQILKQLKHLGVNPDKDSAHDNMDSDTQRFSDGSEGGDMACEGDLELADEGLLRVRDYNARRGAVSLIQLASFGGCVLLIRSCFFQTLPKPLVSLLSRSDIYKIGQGLEKDVGKMRETFALSVSATLDIRNVCLMWPWFTSHYDFDQFGLHSVADFLFDGQFPDTSYLSPYYITRHLDKEQIRAAAVEVQLSVDLFVFVFLRYLGWRLPADWNSHRYMGLQLQLWSATLLDRSFLDNRLKPSLLKYVSLAAAKRSWDKALLRQLKDHCARGCTLRLATLWAWPLPQNKEALERMLVRHAGESLPCAGRPFVAVDIGRLLNSSHFEESINAEGESWLRADQSFIMVGEDEDGNKYKVNVRIETMDEMSYDGGDGKGLPKDTLTLFGEPHPAEPDPFAKSTYERVLEAAVSRVPTVRLREEWKLLEAQEQEHAASMEEDKMAVEEDEQENECGNEIEIVTPLPVNGILDGRRVLGTSNELGLAYVPPVWHVLAAPFDHKSSSNAGFYVRAQSGGFTPAGAPRRPPRSRVQENGGYNLPTFGRGFYGRSFENDDDYPTSRSRYYRGAKRRGNYS